jgi:transposase
MLLRHYLKEGLSKSEISRRLDVSRDTIHRLIRSGQLDRDLDAEPVRYKPRPPVPTKLEPYRALIVARLEAYPRLSSVRLLEEVRAAGYTGGYTQVKEFVRTVRPREAPEPVVRFETPAGHQAQVDFGEFKFPWGKRYALVVVLGYSRLLWLRFYERQDMRTLFRGLEEAFAFFGGVPRELLFDQMKAVITRDLRLLGGQLVINEEFLRFAAHWGFKARACRPYRAQTKGKVERPITTSGTTSFTGVSSWAMSTWTGSGSAGRSAQQTCASTRPRRNGRGSASSRASGTCCSLWRSARIARSSSCRPRLRQRQPHRQPRP